MTTPDTEMPQGDIHCHTLWNSEPVFAKQCRVHLDNGTDHRATKLEWEDGRFKYLDDEPYSGVQLREVDGFNLVPFPVAIPAMSGWTKALSEGNPALPHKDITQHVRMEMLPW